MLTDKLIDIGFSEYEAKVYSALLSRELLTANEICQLGQIPQGRVYNILSNLEQKGFCIMVPGSVKKYKAVSPKTSFSVMLIEREQSLENIKILQAELEEQYENIEKNENPLDYFQVLTSKQSQVKKFDDLIKMSKKTLYSFNKPPYATGFKRRIEEIKKASAPLRKIIKKGVDVKALFEEEKKEVKPFINMVTYYDSIGEDVRIIEKLPIKMLISDTKICMISLKNNHSSVFKLTSMVVEHTDLTQTLSELFNMYWDKGIKLSEYLEKIK